MIYARLDSSTCSNYATLIYLRWLSPCLDRGRFDSELFLFFLATARTQAHHAMQIQARDVRQLIKLVSK